MKTTNTVKSNESVHLTECLERYIQERVELGLPVDVAMTSRYERDIKAS